MKVQNNYEKNLFAPKGLPPLSLDKYRKRPLTTVMSCTAQYCTVVLNLPAAMLESMVQMLVTIFQMQRLIIICDLDRTSLDLRQQFFRGNHTLSVAKSLNQIDNNILAESNVIICAKNIGRETFKAMTYERFAVNYPWVILHNQDVEAFLSPSKINQQLYFYDMDTQSLYEKYTVNSVVVTTELNMNLPLDYIHERRSNLHGLSMNVAVNSLMPLYGIMRKEKTDTITLPSGDKFFSVDKHDASGILEELLTEVARELNFTVR